MKERVAQEPVVFVNGAVAIIEAAIGLAVAFGLDWDAEQVAGVMAFVIAVGEFIKSIFVRRRVTPLVNPRDATRRRLVPEMVPETPSVGG